MIVRGVGDLSTVALRWIRECGEGAELRVRTMTVVLGASYSEDGAGSSRSGRTDLVVLRQDGSEPTDAERARVEGVLAADRVEPLRPKREWLPYRT